MSTTSRDHKQDSEDLADQSGSVRRHKPRATVSTVAEAAGVSVATVSRVLSGASKYVSPTTRHRVEDAAKRLHYTPNQLIRSLQRGRTHVITFTSFYPGLFSKDEQQFGIMGEICRAARHEGYDVLVPAGTLQPDGCPSVSSLLDGRCDGVILDAPKDAPMLDTLAERGFPVVVLGRPSTPSGIGSVQEDNKGATRKVMDHLLGLGHRRIAHLAGPIRLWDEAQSRLDAYQDALRAVGIAPDPALVQPQEGTASWDVGLSDVEAALRFWLSLSEPPTAVFCANDRRAVALLQAAAQCGARIPEQLSVVGYDDIPMASHTIPPLTTISVDLSQTAMAAVKMLRRFIEGSPGADDASQGSDAEISTRQVVEARLVVRGSTARVPKL